MEAPAALEHVRSLYLELMKRSLLDEIYRQRELVQADPSGRLARLVRSRLGKEGLLAVREREYDRERRAQGRDWPLHSHTMVGRARLDNIEACISRAVADSVPGDVIETGVWRGGSAIFMRAVLAALGVADRVVWVADSFQGVPAPDPERYPADARAKWHLSPELAVPADEVRQNFERYGLLDDQVRLLEGWFKDTLPDAPIERLAVMRLDGDLYESTTDALTNLYPRLSPGGFVIVDDYRAIENCRRAVDDFRREHGIEDEIVEVDWTCVYWRRARRRVVQRRRR